LYHRAEIAPRDLFEAPTCLQFNERPIAELIDSLEKDLTDVASFGRRV
jgi:hypothetical protein